MLFYNSLEDYRTEQQKKLDTLPAANIPEQGIILHVLGPNMNQDKRTNPENYSVTRKVEALFVDYLGIYGDRHRAEVRPRTGRESSLYKGDGVLIRQHRHVFAVSPANCQELSELL
jgi:hypothetical protein